jgi:hypothetical protein
MEAPRLRPLGLGETLDTAIKIYSANFWTLVRTVFIVVAPVQILAAVVQVSASGGLDTTSDTVDTARVIGRGAALIVVFLISSVATQLATATVLRVVSSFYLGESEDWRSSLRFALHRLHSLLWVTFLVDLVAGLGLIFCIAPGVYLYFSWAVAVPVLLLEGPKGRKALRRSRQLVKGLWWKVFGAVFVATILASIITGVLQSVVVGITFNTDNELVRAFVSAIASVIGSTFVLPFTASVVAVVYFDLRVRKEGFDLELLARTLGVEPPEGTTPTWGPDMPPPGYGYGYGQPGYPPPAQPGYPPAYGQPGYGPPTGDQPPYWPPPPGWRPGGG